MLKFGALYYLFCKGKKLFQKESSTKNDNGSVSWRNFFSITATSTNAPFLVVKILVVPLGCSSSKRDFYPLVVLFIYDLVSFFVACGRRPWKNVKSYNKIYPEGSVKGYSESKIGQSPPRRRNSKFLRNRTPKIVQGGVADYGEWPWQVSLRQWRTCKLLFFVLSI